MFYLFVSLLIVLVVLTLIHEPMLDVPRKWVVDKAKAWNAKQQKTYEDYQSPEAQEARRQAYFDKHGV